MKENKHLNRLLSLRSDGIEEGRKLVKVLSQKKKHTMAMRQKLIVVQNFINAVENAIENERAGETSKALANGPATMEKFTTKRSKHAADDLD